MKDIRRLSIQFRYAIDEARNAGDFETDFSFCKFPRGCCGDASDLFAQFLLKNDIRTYYVYGTYNGSSFERFQSHAWLLADNHIIIDITGDQFKDNPVFLNYDKSVYVGAMDDFHRLFEIEDRNIRKNTGIATLGHMCLLRLTELYKKIIKYI